MNFQYFSFKRYFCAFCFAVPFFMAACGDSGSDSDFEDPSGTDEICEDDFCDSESSDSDGKSAGMSSSSAESSSSFQKKEADISASSYKDSSLVGVKYKSDLGMMNIVNGTIYDSTYNHEYKTVRIGPYEWIAENLLDATSAFENYDMCYDNDRNNCKTDGRLFRDYTKNNMCPTGFVVPSSADYRYLQRVTKNLTDAELGFNPQMAGFCRRGTFDMDSLGCSDKGIKTYLLTNNDSMFVVGKDGKARMMESEFYGFYSLRCVRKLSFVENEKQLPICNAETEDDFGDIFVAGAGKNYSCEGGKWVKGSDSDCSWGDRGELHYYGDSLYVCNGSWTLATMNDAGAACADENDGDVRELNGKKFICKDSSWRELNAVEKSIGLCTAKNIGAIDTIPAKDSLEYYYCDTTGWRFAKIVDYVGDCNESKYYDVMEFHDRKYACRTSDRWSEFSAIEKEMGLCTPGKYATIDTVPVGVGAGYYFCDTTGWRTARFADYTGTCDDRRFYETVEYGDVKYACRTDSSWTKFSTLETELGICSPKKLGVFDTSTTANIYKCETTGWRAANIYDFYECTKAKLNTTVEFRSSTYGCTEDLKWKYLDSLSEAFGFCTSGNYAVIKELNGKSYICDSSWRLVTKNDLIGLCNDSTQNTTKVYHDTTFGCDKGKWRTLKNREDYLGMCTSQTPSKVIPYKNYFYKCNGSIWVSVSIKDSLGECTRILSYYNTGEIYTFAGGAYYCDFSTWKLANAEMVLGKCTSSRKEEVGMVGDTAYVCNGVTGWVKYTGPEKEYGLCTNNTDRITFNGEKYGCVGDTGSFEWRAENDLDRKLGFCDGSKTIQWKELDGVDYVCSVFHHEWFTGTFDEMYKICAGHNVNYNYGATVGFRGKTYYCQEHGYNTLERSNFWHELGATDLEVGVCTPERLNETVTLSSSGSSRKFTFVCELKSGPEIKTYQWTYIQ